MYIDKKFFGSYDSPVQAAQAAEDFDIKEEGDGCNVNA